VGGRKDYLSKQQEEKEGDINSGNGSGKRNEFTTKAPGTIFHPARRQKEQEKRRVSKR